MTPEAESEFRDFVAGFADPLARLAHLLTAGLEGEDPHRRAAAALGQTRRRWREVRAAGAPEGYAVEALLARLPRRWRHRGGDLDVELVAPASPVTRAPQDPHARFRRPVAETPDAEAPDAETPDADERAIRDALWTAWQTLEARQRAPLIFVDPQVASPRLASLDMPSGFTSQRRLKTLASQAILRLRAAVAGPDFDFDFDTTLADTLTEHAGDIDASPEPYASALAASRRDRRRLGAAAAAVVAALVAGGVVAVNVADTPRRTPAASTLPSGIASALSTPASTPSSGDGAGAIENLDDSAPLPAAGRLPGGPLAAALSWPVRGNLSQDKALVEGIASNFASARGDIVAGSPHVVFVDDTPYFRVACVVAATPVGTMQSWLYGPVGSTNLRVASSEFDSSGVHGAIAAFLDDDSGHSMLVVIGPPARADVHFGDIYLGAPLSAGATASSDDGVVVRDMSGVPADSVYLQFVGGGVDDWSGRVPGVTLVPEPASADDIALLEAITVDRGDANPQLLRKALAAAMKAVPLSAMNGAPVVLWGGDDEVGNHGIVLRVRTYTGTASLIVAFAGDPSGAIAFPISSSTSDFPVAFPYVGRDGARIGVLPGMPQVNEVGVVVDGVDRGIVPVRFDGFASVAVGTQYGLVAEQHVEVNLIDSSHDRLLGQTTLPQPPHETTAQAMRGVPTR